MSRGLPSMTALLGLLALAGYQNRDKLAELLKGAGSKDTQPGANTLQGPLEDLLGSLSGAAAGGGAEAGDGGRGVRVDVAHPMRVGRGLGDVELVAQDLGGRGGIREGKEESCSRRKQQQKGPSHPYLLL